MRRSQPYKYPGRVFQEEEKFNIKRAIILGKQVKDCSVARTYSIRRGQKCRQETAWEGTGASAIPSAWAALGGGRQPREQKAQEYQHVFTTDKTDVFGKAT